MSGGGNLFGTILNVVSLTPFGAPLRPIAIAYNMANAVSTGNPLGMALSAVGASSYLDSMSPDGFGVDMIGGDGGAYTNLDDWTINAVDNAPQYFDDWGVGSDLSYDASLADVASSSGNIGELQSLMSGNVTQDVFNDVAGRAPQTMADSMRMDYLTGPNAGNMDAALGNATSGLENIYSNALNLPSMDGYFSDAGNSLKNMFTTEGGLQTQYNTIQGMNQGIQNMGSVGSQIQDLSGSSITPDTFNNNAFGLSDQGTTLANTAGDSITQNSPDLYGATSTPSQLEGFRLPSPMDAGAESVSYDNSFNSIDPRFATQKQDLFSLGKLGEVTEEIKPYTIGEKMSSFWDKINTSPTSEAGKQAGYSPLQAGLKGLGGLDSYLRNKDAMKMMQEQMGRANSWVDPNRARGDWANQEWQANFSDPKAGYDTFMTGAGRDFTDQARAAAAKSGRRGAYLNTGRMQSDLASLWAKNQGQRGASLAQGFVGGNNSAATAGATMAPAYASMVKNSNAPIFDALSNISQGRTLKNIFGDE